MSWQDFIRPHLRDLKPYRSARDEYKGQASVYLDANENPYGVARAAHKAMAGAYDVSHLYGGSGRRELLKLYAIPSVSMEMIAYRKE